MLFGVRLLLQDEHPHALPRLLCPALPAAHDLYQAAGAGVLLGQRLRLPMRQGSALHVGHDVPHMLPKVRLLHEAGGCDEVTSFCFS